MQAHGARWTCLDTLTLSQVPAKTDHCTMQPAVRADDPLFSAVPTGAVLA